MKSNFVRFNLSFLKLKSLSKPCVALTLPFRRQALPDCQAPPPAASVLTRLGKFPHSSPTLKNSEITQSQMSYQTDPRIFYCLAAKGNRHHLYR